MPRPARPWFRFYTEAVADRKLRRLKPAQRWLWVAVMAAARESPVAGTLLDGAVDTPMTVAALADYAGMTEREVRATMPEFERAGMVHRDDAGAWVVTNFGRRQFESDDTTARTRKHRRRNVPTSSQGTGEGTADDSSEERSPLRGPATGARHALPTESETETEPPTSSNGFTTPDHPPDDDDHDQQQPDPGQVDQSRADPGQADPGRQPADYERAGHALAMLAQRDLDATPSRIGDPDAWLRRGYDRRRASHGDHLLDLARQHPDATADQLADMADPPRPANAGRTPLPDPYAGQRASLYADAEEGQAHVRAILAEPHRPVPGVADAARAALRNGG